MDKHSSYDDVLKNMDLVREILLRVPVKHVLRCMCVCKKWLALISDPQFCHSHTLRLCRNNPNYPRALLLKYRHHNLHDEIYLVPFANANNDADPSHERILQLNITYPYPGRLSDRIDEYSCSGLLLWTFYPYLIPRRRLNKDGCRYRRHTRNDRMFTESFIDVCNPATSHYVRLNYPSDKFYPPYSTPYLAFDPLRSPYFKILLIHFIPAEGIGVDESGGIKDLFPPEFEISLYSSETGSWSDVGACFSSLLHKKKIDVKRGVYCNGAIHWYNPFFHENLVYFDVHQVWLNEIPGPIPVDSNDKWVKYFGESGGHLHLILTDKYDRALEFDIWELEQDYSGWIIRYHVDFNFLAERLASERPIGLLWVVRQANEEESMLLFCLDSKIMAYNLKDHSTRIFYEVDCWSLKSIQYFETLSCTGLGSKLIPSVTAQ